MFKKLPLNEKGELFENEYVIESPRNLVIVSFPKMGKTYNMVNVPNFLIGDAEKGTEFFKAKNSVNLMEHSSDQEFVKVSSGAYIPSGIFETVDELNQINQMEDYWKLRARFEKPGSAQDKKKIYQDLLAHLQGMKFPIFVIDTITSLQELNCAAALAEYNATHAATAQKTNIKRVDDYGGVNYIRRNFAGLKAFIENNAAPFIIWNGHVAEKKKVLRKGETEISAVDIALDGLLSTTFTHKADSVCVFYRNEKGCFLDFTKKDETDLGSRPQHLSNKIIKIADLNKTDKEGNVVERGLTYWEKIYPELKF